MKDESGKMNEKGDRRIKVVIERWITGEVDYREGLQVGG